VQQAIRAIKKTAPEIIVVADLCLCEYTDHGHCGVVHGGTIDNDETLGLLSKTAVSQAEAGADIVAPSGMMDGQVKAIRGGLDEGGYSDTAIMSYSAKYASSFYGPFREAAECAPVWGDRRSYQMDPPNRREALKEIAMDIEQGADIVMVKPALSYLDVIHAARASFQVPLAAYNVSGEYAMVKAAARNGWLNERSIALEILTGIKRAGADIIITYFAKQASQWLQENSL
jgi:porphobilinogen synthase